MQDKIIDIHCHILPGIDDGPKTMEESLMMVRQAVEQGVGGIIATPHYIPGEIEYHKDLIFDRVFLLQREIDKEKLNCKIYSGMELYLTSKLIEEFDKGNIVSLAGSKYVLVEFPNQEITNNMIDLLHEIRVRGFSPIIAHPERNISFKEDTPLIKELFESKLLFQVNASSLLGSNGKTIKRLAQSFIKRGKVSFIASDAHSFSRRAIKLDVAMQIVNGSIDDDLLSELFCLNGERILCGNNVTKYNIEERKSLFFKVMKYGKNSFKR